MDRYSLLMLLQEYRENPDHFTDQEAEMIAGLARQFGKEFPRESKPIRKMLYGAGEMATFGMLPDSWEPHSRGQDVYGESTIDAIASGAGSLLGLVGGGYGAYRGARGLMRSGAANRMKSGAADIYGRASNMAPRAYDRARAVGSTVAGEGRDQTRRAMSALRRRSRDPFGVGRVELTPEDVYFGL